MKNPNDERIKQLQAKLFTYVSIYDKGKMTRDDIKDFSGILIEYCKLTRHSNCSLKTPSVKFDKLENKHKAKYVNENNEIIINEKLFDDIFSKKEKLSLLINAIGHEMKHFNQNNSIIDYDNLSSNEQQKIDEKSKESIDSYKNYFYLSKEDVKILHKLLAPYLKNNEIPKGYRTIGKFYSDISFISYFSILSEKEAREEGVDFALNFYNDLSKSEFKISNELLQKEEESLNKDRKKDEEDYYTNKSKYDNFFGVYSADEKTILEIVEKIEAENQKFKKIDTESYGYVLRFLIRDKTVEQKESLLKNAIFNGYSRFLDIIIDSMKNEIDFKSNKNNISEFVSKCFTGEEFEGTNQKISNRSFFKDYSPLLTQEDFENVVGCLLKDDIRKAKAFITFSSIKSFTLDSVIKYQETILRNKENLKGNENLFFNGLFSQISMENKIELLTSNKIQPEFIGLLVKNIRRDIRYSSFKTQLEPLLKDYPQEEEYSNLAINKLFEKARKKEEKISSKQKNVSTNEEYDISEKSLYNTNLRLWFNTSTEKGMDELLFSYAKISQKYYYSEKGITIYDIQIQKQKKLNDEMRKILKNKLRKEKEDSTGLNLDFYINASFSESIIDEIAKNTISTYKLFYIMATGIYEKNRKRVQLTQKQRESLSSVLTKVSDKRISMDLNQIQEKENDEINIGIQM